MFARIRRSMENKEQGFTLIELLVVMIIIGILAAIAIPTFLNQRRNGYRSEVKADLKNAATALESAAVDKNGNYTLPNASGVAQAAAGDTFAPTNSLSADGVEFTGSAGVTTTLDTVGAATYCIEATHSSLDATEIWSFNKTTGTPTMAACP
jgi:prepilin-type N-terminal cleavage/methylation domain-containing protein